MSTPRDRFLKQSLGTLSSKVRQSRVLLVGAGGIGCELLKNLVQTGFGEVHVVDLDTIDLSNLNRQFLFRHEHIKKPKATVARDVASKFNPDVHLESYHADIKNCRFNVSWFSNFDLVFNALDNLEARRHVNRMCLAADVPLVESGTTGFNGQVQAILKGKTECYDCTPKQLPKSFPVCTIRSTPSQPIHCIVWAKSYLFPELFGVSEDSTPELDHSEDAENAQEIENLRKEAYALKEVRSSMSSENFAIKVFEKVFHDDIARLRDLEEVWKSRKPPEPLSFETLQDAARAVDCTIAVDDQKVWNLVENFSVFKDSLGRLSRRLQSLKESATGAEKPVLLFDKDDSDALDFVASSANLRSHVFGMEPRSKFDIKQMAGNIIPAVATANAMTAALCVLQAFKVLKNDFNGAKMVFLERSGARAINTDTLKPPNPQCPVCGVAFGKISVDLGKATLNDLVEGILRLRLGYGEEFSVSNQLGTLFDPDLEDNLSRKLADLGVKGDSFITVVDEEDDNPRINLELLVAERTAAESTCPVILESELDIPTRPKSSIVAPSDIQNGAVANGVAAANGTLSAAQRKRTAEDAGLENGELHRTKKFAKTSTGEDGDGSHPIILDDDDGTIFIDDD